jgi:pimeloyl-ACP methyl ester carboxylesterase
MRAFSSKIQKGGLVQLRGTFLPCTRPDMPTILAFPDLLEDPKYLSPLFNAKLREFRNVWLLSYRNSYLSDRADTMTAEEIASDVINFMDQKKITMASALGHGFGGKIASIAGILKYHRITSVVGLDYAPQNYTKHECWLELKAAVEFAAKLDIKDKTRAQLDPLIRAAIKNPRLRKNMLENLMGDDKSGYMWKSGMKELAQNMNLRDNRDNLGLFPLIGIFPGRALFFFAERGNWVHQGSNTIPIYNLFPQLNMTYGHFLDHIDTDNHWMHESDCAPTLARRIAEFYRWYDGVHPTLMDRSEIGKVALPVRSRLDLTKEEASHLVEEGNHSMPKMIPMHRHHNWAYNPDAPKYQVPQ